MLLTGLERLIVFSLERDENWLHVGRLLAAGIYARLPRMPLIVILIILIIVFGGGGYYMGPGIGYYGGGGLDLVLIIVLLFLLFGRGRRGI
jgi:hypothetical protein